MSIKKGISRGVSKLLIRLRLFFNSLLGKYFASQKIKRRFFLAVFFSLILLVAIYFSISFFAISEARLELLSLKQELEAGLPCHESCRLDREEAKQRIAAAWPDDKRLRTDLEAYFLTASLESNQELVRELLKIIVLSEEASGPPEFVFDYLSNFEGVGEVKAEIINLFLVPLADSDLADYYRALLTSGEEEIVLAAAVKALSQLPDKTAWRADDLELYCHLILGSELSPALRLDLFFLINSYQEFFPQEAALAFAYIYETTLEDEFKALSADSLARLGLTGYEAPIVSEEKWAQYFEIKR